MATRHYRQMAKKTPPRPPSDDADKFVVRMPAGLRGRIAVAAFHQHRSMNAEIVDALEKAFPEVPGLDDLQRSLDQILTAYKQGTSQLPRHQILGILSAISLQIAHDVPEGNEPVDQ